MPLGGYAILIALTVPTNGTSIATCLLCYRSTARLERVEAVYFDTIFRKGSLMNANDKLVTAVFRNRAEADRAFEMLHRLGYDEQEINVLMSEKMRSTYYSGKEEGTLGAGSAGAEG